MYSRRRKSTNPKKYKRIASAMSSALADAAGVLFFFLRYSIFRLLRQALSGHNGWKPAWRDATPKRSYDVVIIGGGGHGLATAYYLAKVHGITRVAVLERS